MTLASIGGAYDCHLLPENLYPNYGRITDVNVNMRFPSPFGEYISKFGIKIASFTVYKFPSPFGESISKLLV